MSYRAAASPANQHNKREPHRASSPPSSVLVAARADVTTTVILGPSNGGSSGSGSAKIPWAALAGGLVAGIVIVVVVIVCWRCWGKKNDRTERGRRKSEQFERVEWRPGDSRSRGAAHRHDHHQRTPSNGTGYSHSSKHSSLSSPSSPLAPTYSPQHRPINVDVETRNPTASGASFQDERRRRSGEGRHRSRKSVDDKPREVSGPEDLGYKVSTVPYGGPSSDSATAAPAPEDEKAGDSPSPRDARTASSQPGQSSRKENNNEVRREAPAAPHYLTATGPRRYAPVRPSPLAQASYRTPSPSPPSASPASNSPSTRVNPHERQPQLEPLTLRAQTHAFETSPASPSFGKASDPFLAPPRPQQSYQPQHRDYQYHDETGSDRPVSGVGYAI